MGGSGGWRADMQYEKDSEIAWAKKPEDRNEHERRIVQSDCDMHNAMIAETNWKAVYIARGFIIVYLLLVFACIIAVCVQA